MLTMLNPTLSRIRNKVMSGISLAGEGRQTNFVITSIMTVRPITSNTGSWTGLMGQA